MFDIHCLKKKNKKEIKAQILHNFVRNTVQAKLPVAIAKSAAIFKWQNVCLKAVWVILQQKQILNEKTTWPLERFFQALQNLTKREFLALFV